MAKTDSENNDKNVQMPLFYNAPIPLDAKAHGDLCLKKNFGLGFTKTVNAVPINMIEMPQICHFYPIGFAPDASATPVAIIGLRDNENLFLDDNDQWVENTYIPAYIRRYPFIFSEIPGKDQLSLCIDLDKNIVESKGDQPFFEEVNLLNYHKTLLNFVNPITQQRNKRLTLARHCMRLICSLSVKLKLILGKESVLTLQVSVLLMKKNWVN